MKLRDHGLSLAALAFFLVAFLGQVLTGNAEYNADRQEHGEAPVSLVQYFDTGHFGEATFENWESEFLQLALFVILTALLVQKGAEDSRKPKDEKGAGEESVDEDPEQHRDDPDAPWAVRKGGLALKLYRNSLGIALGLLFLFAFFGHAATGAAAYSAEQQAHGQAGVGMLGYLGTSRFWFESFQNWQSEFLAVLSLTVLSIWLRQYGSPQSKPVHAPHAQTGSE